MDDQELLTLIRAAQAGDQPAFGELVRRFQDMAYGYAYAILKDFQQAEDAAQEAFIEAYRCLPKLEIPQAFPVWLKRIIFKHCDRLTRGKRPILAPLDCTSESDVAAIVIESSAGTQTGSLAEVHAEHAEMRHRVMEALDALTDDQRTVTTLYYINGYAYKEIATFLDVPTSTVKSRLYTSRERLRERMMEMIKEELQSNALPESFAEETLARAIEEAAALNAAGEFDEAEDLLRDIMVKTPETAMSIQNSALRELNRTLMWGQYATANDERRYELVANARTMLDRGVDDEYVWRELARTLLYIPQMAEAAKHIKTWIEHKGPNVDRLGMLAWAEGCLGNYEAAVEGWRQVIACYDAESKQPTPDPDRSGHLPDASRLRHICLSLVDCLAAAGRARKEPKLLADAAQIAEEGWRHGKAAVVKPEADPDTLWGWVYIYHLAGIDAPGLARHLVGEINKDDPARDQRVIGLQAWFDPPDAFLADWPSWLRTFIAAGNWDDLERLRGQVHALRWRRLPETLTFAAEVALQILQEHLNQAPSSRKHKVRNAIRYWHWVRYEPNRYLEVGDLEGAERVAREGVEALGYEGETGASLLIAVAATGEPTPIELMALLERKGTTALDPAGLFGWYAIGREAAATGEVDTALDALHRVLNSWTNGPRYYPNLWEADARWGDLRTDPRWRALFAEARARIGPIYGQLHYFPGW